MIDGWELNLLRFMSADESDLGCEDIFLRTRGDGVRWIVNCSDTFYWATADGEEISGQDDVDLLHRCYDDLKAAGDYHEVHAFTLWCSRKRRMRPMRLWYKEVLKGHEAAIAVFDSAGPERDPASEG